VHGGAWSWVAAVNTSTLGYLIVGLFFVTWVGSLAIWRLARVEERWSVRAVELSPRRRRRAQPALRRSAPMSAIRTTCRSTSVEPLACSTKAATRSATSDAIRR
jgi:hypothetical protein